MVPLVNQRESAMLYLETRKSAFRLTFRRQPVPRYTEMVGTEPESAPPDAEPEEHRESEHEEENPAAERQFADDSEKRGVITETTVDEIDLVKKGDSTAFESLLNRHSAIISRCARRFTRPNLGLEFSDLCSVGNEALWDAAKKFDPNREVRFSTFATTLIFRGIYRYARRTGELLHRSERWRKIEERVEALEYETYTLSGRTLSETEVAALLDLTAQEVLEVRSLRRWIVSGDQKESEDDADVPYANFPDDNDSFAKVQDRDTVKFLLKDLTPRERDVLILRLDLLGDGEHTLDEIGKKWKITAERVRQIEAKAYSKFRSKRILDMLYGPASASAPNLASPTSL